MECSSTNEEYKTKSPSLLRGFCTQSRDRTGMEVNPLVFETSASTNSAIWAWLKELRIAKIPKVFNSAM